MERRGRRGDLAALSCRFQMARQSPRPRPCGTENETSRRTVSVRSPTRYSFVSWRATSMRVRVGASGLLTLLVACGGGTKTTVHTGQAKDSMGPIGTPIHAAPKPAVKHVVLFVGTSLYGGARTRPRQRISSAHQTHDRFRWARLFRGECGGERRDVGGCTPAHGLAAPPAL